MSKKTTIVLQIVVVFVLVALGIWMYTIYHSNKNEYNELEHQKKSIHVADKKKIKDGLDNKEVQKYKHLEEKKYKEYMHYDLPEGVFNTDNTGVETIKNKLTPNDTPPFNKKTPKEKFIKLYDDVDIKVKQTAAQKDDKGNVDVYSLVDTKYKGKEIKKNYRLVHLKFDENDEVIGGELYGQQ